MSKVNKSHATGYGVLSYQTAYLKANYFLEYATSVLKSVQGVKTKLSTYASIVESKGVKIIFPSINESNLDMDIYDFENNIISTGFYAINGFPGEMGKHIIAERDLNGKFISFKDFLDRMSKYNIDSKSVKSLIYAGAFDCFDKNFNRLIEYYEAIGEYNKKMIEIEEGNQISLLSLASFKPMAEYMKYEPDNNEYDLQDRLSKLCEYNNVGIHSDIKNAYTEIKYKLVDSKRVKDDEYFVRDGVVSGILEDKFEKSKSGKAYITTVRTFEGESIKIIVSSKKVDSITDDITKYKTGMAIDVSGTFKFPKPTADDDSYDEAGGGDDNPLSKEPICFPSTMVIKEIKNPNIDIKVILDFDNMAYDLDMVCSYFGVNNLNEVMSKILSNFAKDGKGKILEVKYKGTTYVCSKKVNISFDDIKKLGCTYKVA